MMLGKWQWIVDIIAIILGSFLFFKSLGVPLLMIAGLAIFFYGLIELIFIIFKIKNRNI